MVLFSRSSVIEHGAGPVAVWTTDLTAIIVASLIGGVMALVLGIFAFSRRTSYL
jgi:hypothetical protein